MNVAVSVVFLRTGRHHQAAGGKDKGDMFHVKTGFMRLDSDISENKDSDTSKKRKAPAEEKPGESDDDLYTDEVYKDLDTSEAENTEIPEEAKQWIIDNY